MAHTVYRAYIIDLILSTDLYRPIFSPIPLSNGSTSKKQTMNLLYVQTKQVFFCAHSQKKHSLHVGDASIYHH